MSAELLIEASTSKTSCTSVCQSLPSPPKTHETHMNMRPLSKRDDNLPYFEFLNLSASLNFGEPILQGSFFDSGPSPSILPSDSSSPIGIAESDWMLDLYSGDQIFEGALDCPKQRRIDRFYKSFATLLLPSSLYPKPESQDQLDLNRRLQAEIPGFLSNIPEKYEGESKSVVQTLLGPPQLSAAICLLEIVVYLYSNDLVFSNPNTISQWIIETLPFPNLSRILETKLPTLQAFQSALLLFAIDNSHVDFVKNLLELDTGLKDWICSSSEALESAVLNGTAEVVELILEIVPNVLSFQDDHWKHSLLHMGLSTNIAELLAKAGANLNSPVYVDGYWSTSVGVQTYPLIETIQRGDIDLAQFLISVGADVNAVPVVPDNGDQDQRPSYPLVTPLRMAIAMGRFDIVSLLVNNGANVHEVCGWEAYVNLFRGPGLADEADITLTPLQAAAGLGDIDMVKALLHASARVNDPAYGRWGQTALYAATSAEHLDVVKLLLQAGVDIDVPGCNPTELPCPALLVAVERNNAALVELLLSSGADPNAPAFSCYGSTILEVAKTRKASLEIVALLLERGGKDKAKLNDSVRIRHMRVQLLEAVWKADLEAVTCLLGKGVKVDMEPIPYSGVDQVEVLLQDEDGLLTEVPLLHLAIAAKSVSVSLFVCLLDHIKKDELNEQHKSSLEPLLHHAVRKQRIDFVKALLDAGTDINTISSTSKTRHSYCTVRTPTALHIACIFGNVAMVSLLLHRGADINLRLPDSGTPMQLCLESGARRRLNHVEVFNLLLDNGADINAPPASKCGHTVLQLVILSITTASCPSMIAMVQRVLELGADVNAPAADINGFTALQAASKHGNLDLIGLLLDHGADINQHPSKYYGGTALQKAARAGHIRTAQLLLSRGANVNTPGSEIGGHTALEEAASHGRLDMVQLLINAGADGHLPMEERYISSLRLAKVTSHLGGMSLLQKYRDEAVSVGNKTRVQEVGCGDNIEDSSQRT